MRHRKNKPGDSGRRRLSKTELDKLVSEATVDCYGEEEESSGLFTMLEDHLELPFETTILGMPVNVEEIELTEGEP